MHIALCIIVAHNTAQKRPDNFPSYPPDNYDCFYDVYLSEGGSDLEKFQHWIHILEFVSRMPVSFIGALARWSLCTVSSFDPWLLLDIAVLI